MGVFLDKSREMALNLYFLLACLFAFFILGCQKNESQYERGIHSIQNELKKNNLVSVLGDHRSKTYTGTLDVIKDKKNFRVLTANNSFNYFVYRGKARGYEYELVKNFTDHLNQHFNFTKKTGLIRFELIPVRRDELIPLLIDGYGDFIAAGLTDTPLRKKQVSFTVPYNEVEEIIVGPKGLNLKTWRDLAGLSVYVRRSSSYYESLIQVNDRLKKENLKSIKILLADESLETEEIIQLVGLKKYSLTVADSHIAQIAESIFEGVQSYPEVVVREKAKISWAVPKQSNELLKILNHFLPNYKKGSLLGNINLKNYFKNIDRIKTRTSDLQKNQLSEFDSYFKKYSKIYDWDWRLIAALAYQESRFEQDIINRWGAIGVMQIKRMVASEPYVNILPVDGQSNAKNNIHAGIKYLDWIKKTYFLKSEIKSKDCLRLSLAAYNAGPGRLLLAQKHAVKLGLNPNVWFKNVEYALLSMGHTEPVKYVSDINRRFLSYALLVK